MTSPKSQAAEQAHMQARIAEVVERFSGLVMLEDYDHCSLRLDERYAFVTYLMNRLRAIQPPVSYRVTRRFSRADLALHIYRSIDDPASHYLASITYESPSSGLGNREDIVATEHFHVPTLDTEESAPTSRVYRFAFRKLLENMVADGGASGGRWGSPGQKAGRILRERRSVVVDHGAGSKKGTVWNERRLQDWYSAYPLIETVMDRPDLCDLAMEEKLEFFGLTQDYLTHIRRDSAPDRISLEIVSQVAAGRGRREGTFAVMRYNAAGEDGAWPSQDFIAKTIESFAVSEEKKHVLWQKAVRIILEQLRRTMANIQSGAAG